MRSSGVKIVVASCLVISAVAGVALLAAGDEAPVTQPSWPPPPPPPPPPPREGFDEPPSVHPEQSRGTPPVAPPLPPPTVVALLPRPGKQQPVDPEMLAREAALLDRARAEAKTDPELALRSLIEHEQQFPAAGMQNEAKLIKLEALLRLSRREEADELAGKIVARDASLAKPVQKLLEGVRPR